MFSAQVDTYSSLMFEVPDIVDSCASFVLLGMYHER